MAPQASNVRVEVAALCATGAPRPQALFARRHLASQLSAFSRYAVPGTGLNRYGAVGANPNEAYNF